MSWLGSYTPFRLGAGDDGRLIPDTEWGWVASAYGCLLAGSRQATDRSVLPADRAHHALSVALRPCRWTWLLTADTQRRRDAIAPLWTSISVAADPWWRTGGVGTGCEEHNAVREENDTVDRQS